MHFVNSFSPLMENMTVPWNLGIRWLPHQALTIVSRGEKERVCSSFEVEHEASTASACPVSPVPRDTSPYSLIHPLETLSHPSPTQLTTTTKIPPMFSISEGRGQFLSSCHFVRNQLRSRWTSTGAGRRGRVTSPLLLAVCPGSDWDILETSAQGTRIHSPFQGLGSILNCALITFTNKYIMQFMLCSIDFNDSVAVLTLLYLLLAYTGSLRCNYSERAPVLNQEALPCQCLCTMLLSVFSITLTTLSFFLLSLQAPLFRTHCKFCSFHTASWFCTLAPFSQYQITNFHLQLSHTVGLHLSGKNFRQAPWHCLPGSLKFEESPLLGMHTSTLMPMAQISILNKQERGYTGLLSPFPQTNRMTISVLALSSLLSVFAAAMAVASEWNPSSSKWFVNSQDMLHREKEI